MKSIFTYLGGFFLLSTILLSCSKDVQNETRQQTAAPQIIKATVPAGQTYILNMGTGTTASIVTQALHYQLSEVATAPNGGAVYKYTAGKGYSGADEVTLQQTATYTSQSSGGCHNNHMNGSTTTTTFKTVVIKFDVAN